MRRTDSSIVTSPATLAGATVLVTRPAATAATLKRRIAALGGIALGLPGVGLRAAEDSGSARAALNDARKAELAVFISPAAVRYAFALLPTLRFARAVRVCAVGAGTARALQRRGVRRVLWPMQRQDSEGLLALAEFARLRGRRIALIGAPGGRDLLACGAARTRRARAKYPCIQTRSAASDPSAFRRAGTGRTAAADPVVPRPGAGQYARATAGAVVGPIGRWRRHRQQLAARASGAARGLCAHPYRRVGDGGRYACRRGPFAGPASPVRMRRRREFASMYAT